VVDASKSLKFRIASFCAGASCVAMAADTATGELVLRDTKSDAQGPGSELRYTAQEMRDFIAGVKAGEFDDLVDAVLP
jgi:Domain of unknown function (DUF397)